MPFAYLIRTDNKRKKKISSCCCWVRLFTFFEYIYTYLSGWMSVALVWMKLNENMHTHHTLTVKPQHSVLHMPHCCTVSPRTHIYLKSANININSLLSRTAAIYEYAIRCVIWTAFGIIKERHHRHHSLRQMKTKNKRVHTSVRNIERKTRRRVDVCARECALRRYAWVEV